MFLLDICMCEMCIVVELIRPVFWLQYMAPNLAPHRRPNLGYAMILGNTLETHEIANVARCSKRSIKAVHSLLRPYKSSSKYWGKVTINAVSCLRALIEHLFEEPQHWPHVNLLYLKLCHDTCLGIWFKGLYSVQWCKKYY